MKTPDEIKKGLEVCQGNTKCDQCPYGVACIHALIPDALSYIQQLEDAIDKTTQLMQSATEVIKRNQEQLESTYSQVKKSLCGKENVSWVEVLEAANQLKSRLAQVERERDAAVRDLQKISFCEDCKHLGKSKKQNPCRECQENYKEKPNWQWRGVCPENTKEETK